MLETVVLPLDEIYVPVKRRKLLDENKVETIAESIIEDGQRTPIQVRRGKGRFVLLEGLHRLEALRALGEASVDGFVTRARQH